MDGDNDIVEFKPSDFECVEDDDIGELGCGAQSIVRLAKHQCLGWVAIKCFAVLGDRVSRKIFEETVKKELQILRAAANPSVVSIHGIVKWPRAMGLVMEFLPAGSLRQFGTPSSGNLPPRLILRMAFEIASALVHMHELPSGKRLIHGDLKPENVLLTADFHCKIADFGSAELQALTGSATATNKKTTKLDMTLAYAAPEKLMSLNSKPRREHDVYSFGMLLYVLLNRKLPYQNTAQESAFIEMIKNGRRPEFDSLHSFMEAFENTNLEDAANFNSNNAFLMQELESIVKQCWQQNPSDRPSMCEVRDRMERLQHQQLDANDQEQTINVSPTFTSSFIIPDDQQLVGLQYFSPTDGAFAAVKKGNIVHHVTNVEHHHYNIASETVFTGDSVTYEPGNENQRSQIGSDGAETPGSQSVNIQSEDNAPNMIQVPQEITLNELLECKDNEALPLGFEEWPELRKNYNSMLKKGKFDEAKQLEEKLRSLILKCEDVSAEEVTQIAENMSAAQKQESFVVFGAAAILTERMGNCEDRIRTLEKCIYGMKRSSKVLIEGRSFSSSLKAIIKDYVIPLMMLNLEKMESMPEVDTDVKCLQVCWGRHHISYTYYLCGERLKEKEALEQATNIMEKHFQDNVKKHGRLYGMLLNNVGAACEHQKEFKEAAKYYKKSIVLTKKAKDYTDELERENDIKSRKQHLEKVKRIKK